MQGTYKGFTITVGQPTDKGRDYTVPVTYEKDGKTEEGSFSGIVSRQGLLSAIKNKIDSDENKQSLADASNFVLDAPEPVPPTAAELEKAAWEADWQKLQGLQQYIDAGVFTGEEKPITDLRTKVKNGFKPAYLGL